jgi:hypothetical protein
MTRITIARSPFLVGCAHPDGWTRFYASAAARRAKARNDSNQWATMAIPMADEWPLAYSRPRASRRRARGRQTPLSLRCRVRVPFGAAPVSYKPELVGRQGRFPLTALPSGHARGAGHCVTFPARYNYTTHCELRSRVRPTRRCGDMDIHSTSTGGAATKRQTRPWAIHHIAARAEVRRHGAQCVGIVHDEPDG